MAETAALLPAQIKSTTGIAFNKAPEMKAKEIADVAVDALKSGEATSAHTGRPLLPCSKHV